jgi:hypothetical protein
VELPQPTRAIPALIELVVLKGLLELVFRGRKGLTVIDDRSRHP